MPGETWDYINCPCTRLAGVDNVAPTSDPTWSKVLVAGPPNEYITDSVGSPAAPGGAFRFHSDSQNAAGILETDVGSLTDDVTLEMRVMVKQNSNIVSTNSAIRAAIYTGKHLPGFQLRPQASGDDYDVYFFEEDSASSIDSGLVVTLPVDEWHRLRLVVDGSGVQPNSNFYLDGVLVGALAGGRVFTSFEGLIQMLMGSGSSGINEWDLGEIKVTNGQQTPAQLLL